LLKNVAALESSVFPCSLFGFACSIGAQLEPCGRLNPATYRLIGKVFKPFSEREEWARPSRPLVEAAVLTGEDPLFEHRMPDGVMGATQLLEELSVQFDVIDGEMPFDDTVARDPDDFAGGDFHEWLDAFVRGAAA
jgi:hypothetical protein